MGATSVTGTGIGSAEGMNKGSDRMTLGNKHLIGAHVVAAGTVTLSGTSGAIEVPEQTGLTTDYGVYVTSNSATNAYISSDLAAVSDTDTWTFSVTAGSGAKIYWQIVKNGL